MIKSGQVILETDASGINRFHCSCLNTEEKYSYAFHVYRDGQLVEKHKYQDKPEITYWAMEEGEYTFKVGLMNEAGEKVFAKSDSFNYTGSDTIHSNLEAPRRRFAWIHNVIQTLAEIWLNRKRMIRITRYDYRVLNQDAYLGNLWNILNPLIQIGTFWFVFGIGLRGGKDVDGFPYILWMLSGMVPWFFLSPGITRGANAIRSRGISALKMRYPIATMPVETILVSFYSHIWMVGFLLVTLLVSGVKPSWNWLNIIYYFVYAIVFLSSLAMVTSVLGMIAVDFQKLIQSLIRLLFYLTPILWSTENLPVFAQNILRLNPCLYYVNGFRDSLLYGVPFYAHYKEIIVFWTLNIVLLIWGSTLQIKYKNQFLDLE